MKAHFPHKRILALALAAALLTALVPGALAWQRQGEYRECLALATDGTRWGYVNGAGSLVIPLRFSEAEPFFLGMAKVRVGTRTGLLGQDGSYLVTPAYDELEYVGWGLYAGRRGTLWELLTPNELPIGSRAEAGNSHALYTGAASIAWETTTVVIAPEPEPTPEETAGAAPTSEATSAPEAGEAPRAQPEPVPVSTPVPVTETRLELVLRWSGGEEVRLDEAELQALLREREVPGWAFPLDREREAGFGDVSGRDWFSPWVNIVYSTGLMEGRGDNCFQPWERLKVCEALKLVAIMDSKGAGREVPAMTPELWYRGYVDYCMEYGILREGEFGDYERPITRSELALLISRTSLYNGCADINDPEIIRRSVPDVETGDYAAEAIFGLYAKGVLTGYGSSLLFQPDAPIVRAEVAAMVARMVRPEQRVTLELGTARSISIRESEEE